MNTLKYGRKCVSTRRVVCIKVQFRQEHNTGHGCRAGMMGGGKIGGKQKLEIGWSACAGVRVRARFGVWVNMGRNGGYVGVWVWVGMVCVRV